MAAELTCSNTTEGSGGGTAGETKERAAVGVYLCFTNPVMGIAAFLPKLCIEMT